MTTANHKRVIDLQPNDRLLLDGALWTVFAVEPDGAVLPTTVSVGLISAHKVECWTNGWSGQLASQRTLGIQAG